MDLQKILNNDFSGVQDTDGRNYWFVRTDRGDYYDTYFENSFLAIGWNEVTLNDIRTVDHLSVALRTKIRRNPQNGIEKLENITSQEGKITGIITKNKAFFDLKRGDIVLMPSAQSQYLAFGIIKDDQVYNEVNSEYNCPYYKRRKVDWLKSEKADLLDAKFAYIKKSFHAISLIDRKYHDVIDNFLFNSYTKDGYSNISFKIKTTDDINYEKLRSLLDNLITIAKQHNDFIGETEDFSETTIKLNLQSPGFINLRNAGKGLIFAIGLITASCEERNNGTTGSGLASQAVTRENLDVGLISDTMGILDYLQSDIN